VKPAGISGMNVSAGSSGSHSNWSQTVFIGPSLPSHWCSILTGRSAIVEALFEAAFTKKGNAGDKIENFAFFLPKLTHVGDDFIGHLTRRLLTYCRLYNM
jgi:hypothetical protein